MTVLEGIQKSADFLAKKNIDSPRLHAELLLAHLLKMPRMKLYLNFERVLTSLETDALRELVRRRGQHEPLQHLTGSAPFCGLEIAVNRNVLIPRPETELLAELSWQFLNPLETPGAEAKSVLDFGTGSGCIAIALAVKCPRAKIVALDVSPEALAVAAQNAAANLKTEQITFLQSNAFASLAPGTKFDLIVANPPYIPTAEIETLPPEVREFDPRGALDGGADGLDFYRLLAGQAARFLKPNGAIMLEFGDGQSEDVKKKFENQNWIVEAIKEDYSGRARILIAKPAA